MAVITELIDNSSKVLSDFNNSMQIALEKVGLAAEANAKIEITKVVYDTPQSPSYKRTGRLRNSLSHATDSSAAYIGTNVEYAAYVEFGTVSMKPRPYIKPAVLDHIEEYKEIVRSTMMG